MLLQTDNSDLTISSLGQLWSDIISTTPTFQKERDVLRRARIELRDKSFFDPDNIMVAGPGNVIFLNRDLLVENRDKLLKAGIGAEIVNLELCRRFTPTLVHELAHLDVASEIARRIGGNGSVAVLENEVLGSLAQAWAYKVLAKDKTPSSTRLLDVDTINELYLKLANEGELQNFRDKIQEIYPGSPSLREPIARARAKTRVMGVMLRSDIQSSKLGVQRARRLRALLSATETVLATSADATLV